MGAEQAPPPRRKRETLTSRVFSAADTERVPLRTILTTVGVVVLTGIVLSLAWSLREDLLLLVVAVFFAVVLAGPVSFLERRGLGRGTATTLVFLVGFLIFVGLAWLFGYPLVTHLKTFIDELPRLEHKASQGKGWVGGLARRFHVQHWLKQNLPKLKKYVSSLSKPALGFGAAAVTTMVALVAVAFLTYFLLLDLPRIWEGCLSLLPEDRALRVDRVVREATRGATGYVLGNLITSIIAGVVVLVSLLIFGVPFAVLLGLWVALVDLLPIVGTIVAAAPVVFVALLHSPTAAIGVLVVILVYQQVENHVLNPVIMSRTVRLSKLGILLAVLFFATIGDRLAGIPGTFVGALLGIPLGSAIQVLVREARHPRPVAREVTGDS